MNPYDLPDFVTSQDMQAVLGVGRAQLSRVRSGAAGFPSPDPGLSTIRRPIWKRTAILRWLVASGRQPAAILPPLDTPPEGPVTQRWQFDHIEFIRINTDTRDGEVVAMRYRPLNSRDPRTLTICTPVGEGLGGALHLGPYLRPEVAAALGYRDRGLQGAVAVITPTSRSEYPRIIGVNLPVDVTTAAEEQGLTPFEMRVLHAPDVAALIGHPLPLWPAGAVSKEAAAQWRPEPAGAPLPVHAGIPPALAAAHRLRIQCRTVLSQIASGDRTAPDPIAAELAHLGNAAWDTALRHVFGYPGSGLDGTPEGWVPAIVPPRSSTDEADPILPTQEPSVDLFHGLEWLVAQEDLPDDMARFPVGYFGYPDSIKVASVDLAAVPEDLHALRDGRAFVDIPARSNWLHTALDEAAHASGQGECSGCRTAGWAADPAPDSHPALRCGEVLHFHVPRTLLPIGEPVTVHLVGQGDKVGRTYTGFVVDGDGAISPLPLVPGSLGKLADTLAAIALGVDTPVHLGGTPKVHGGPEPLTRMVEAMRTTDHLAIDWATLTALVGPRPDAADEYEMLRIVDDYDYPWGAAGR